MRAAWTRGQVDSAFGGKQGVGVLGLAARGGAQVRVGPLEAVTLGAQKTWDVTSTTLFYLGRMVTGQVGADQLHGPGGIAKVTGTLTQQAIEQARVAGVNWLVAVAYVLIQLAALISVSMGILNLMPVPVLDGGHLHRSPTEAKWPDDRLRWPVPGGGVSRGTCFAGRIDVVRHLE